MTSAKRRVPSDGKTTTQPPKLPKKVDENTTDHEVIEMLFGKEAAAELERMAGVKPMNPS